MPRRKTTGDKPEPKAIAQTEARVEALLDDLEEAMLSGEEVQGHDLIEQLWKARRQAPEVLARRIVDGRTGIPGLALDLLGGFAGSRAPTILRRIAENPNVDDIVRFGARRRAGWPQHGETKRRRAFLATLKDAEGTLVRAAGQASAAWPPDGEINEEVLDYLAVLPAEQQQRVVGRAVTELDQGASWLLRAAVHLPDPAVQRQALEALVKLRDPGAAGSLDRLAKTAADPAIRTQAAVSARRVRMQLVDQPGEAESLTLPPVERALVSMIDSDGGQVIVVVRRWAEGVLLVLDVFHNDHWGIKNTFGAARTSPERVEDIVEGLEDEGIHLVEVDLAATRGVLAAAVEVNVACGRGIPPAFELWEPFVHESYPPAENELVPVVELDDTPYANRPDLIRASEQLAMHPFFELWTFDPEAVLGATAGVPTPRGGKLTDRHYRALIERLADEPERSRLRGRLRRQAWLLEQSGDLASRDLALAVSAQLAGGIMPDLGRQPFLRALVNRGLFMIMMLSEPEQGLDY